MGSLYTSNIYITKISLKNQDGSIIYLLLIKYVNLFAKKKELVEQAPFRFSYYRISLIRAFLPRRLRR